jgi:hypothetical protein
LTSVGPWASTVAPAISACARPFRWFLRSFSPITASCSTITAAEPVVPWCNGFHRTHDSYARPHSPSDQRCFWRLSPRLRVKTE